MISSLLTIHLTASTSFVTRKESGVLSSAFATGDDGKSTVNPPAGGAQPRKVLFYVCLTSIAGQSHMLTIFYRPLVVASLRSRPSCLVSTCGDIVPQTYPKT